MSAWGGLVDCFIVSSFQALSSVINCNLKALFEFRLFWFSSRKSKTPKMKTSKLRKKKLRTLEKGKGSHASELAAGSL